MFKLFVRHFRKIKINYSISNKINQTLIQCPPPFYIPSISHQAQKYLKTDIPCVTSKGIPFKIPPPLATTYQITSFNIQL